MGLRLPPKVRDERRMFTLAGGSGFTEGVEMEDKGGVYRWHACRFCIDGRWLLVRREWTCPHRRRTLKLTGPSASPTLVVIERRRHSQSGRIAVQGDSTHSVIRPTAHTHRLSGINTPIMVRRLPTHPPPAEPTTMASQDKQAPEDSSMKNGIFNEDNTTAPKEQRVMPLFSLKGKTAIVSGSGAGIGLAVVKAFAEAGANVVSIP